MGRLFLLGYRENIACCHDEKHNRANLRHFAHPLSGERSRREITLAQGRSTSIIVDAHTKSQTYYRKSLFGARTPNRLFILSVLP